MTVRIQKGFLKAWEGTRKAASRASREIWSGEAWPSGRFFLPHPNSQLRSGERIKLIPLLCIVCTSVVWGFALFFFFQGLSTWQVSSHPAEEVGESLTGSF